MTYNPSIPQATDFLSTSQGQLLGNFGQLNTQFGIDHTAFNTGSGNGDGFHQKVTLPDKTGGIPSSASNQVVIYNATTSSISAPYYKRDGLATVFPLAPIKAYAVLVGTGSGSNPTIARSYNITSVTCSTFTYTVTLTHQMNTTGTNPYGIMAVSSNGTATVTSSITSPTVFTLFVGSTGVTTGNLITLIVLE